MNSPPQHQPEIQAPLVAQGAEDVKANKEAPSDKKPDDIYDESPIPRLTLASAMMGILISMGGFVFGYDTGKWMPQMQP